MAIVTHEIPEKCISVGSFIIRAVVVPLSCKTPEISNRDIQKRQDSKGPARTSFTE